MPSLKLSTLAVLLALLALASIALALPGPGTCTCAKNGAKGDVASCDTADCYNFCKGKGATGTEKCVTKPKRAFAAEMSPVTETEAFMVQKAMFAIPCDLCEVTVADVQRIPESSCVTAIDNACKVVQKKFPQVKCSNLLETLACGVVRTQLANVNPQEVCNKYARCQVPALEVQPAFAKRASGVHVCRCSNGNEALDLGTSYNSCADCQEACYSGGWDHTVCY